MIEEILQKLTGQYRGDRPTMESLLNGTAYQPQPQQMQPPTIEDLAKAEQRKKLSMETLAKPVEVMGRGASNVAGKIGDFFSGDNYRREAEESAYNIGKLTRMGQDREQANKLDLIHSRTLGQGTQAANQPGTAMNTDPSRGPVGPWRVKRDPYTGEVDVWETPITDKPQQLRQPRLYPMTVNGKKVMGTYNEQTRELEPVDGDEGLPIQQERPPEITESQGNARLFSEQMDEGLSKMHGVIDKGYDPTKEFEAAIGNADPNDVFKGLIKRLNTKEAKQWAQGVQTFINSWLRKTSGAAISASEYEAARMQFVPGYGDDAETVQQKLDAMDRALSSMSLYTTGYELQDGQRVKWGEKVFRRKSKSGYKYGKEKGTYGEGELR
jgi:hypothetical protein